MQFDPMQPWAITPDSVPSMLRILDSEETPEPCTAVPYLLSDPGGEQLELSALGGSGGQRSFLAVVPLSGPVSPDGEYGGTSLDNFRRSVLQLDANPNVGTIVLLVRSPGGTVTGTPEAADAVRGVRDKGDTRIVAIADGMMASAATWIGTAAESVSVTPSGEAGSIGVISMYADASKAYSGMGVDISVIRNPNKKARFTGVEPLSDEMRETMIDRNMSAYVKFKDAMASNRGISAKNVEAKFGGGEMLEAEEALSSGLVDRIETVDVAIGRLMRSKKKAPRGHRAALELAKIQ